MDTENKSSRSFEINNKALKYISIGLSVIPLGPITKDSRGRKDIKWPLGGWKKYQTTIASPTEITKWDAENIGIVTGQISGILVLDLDKYKDGYDHELEKSFNLPITPTAETAGGGQQLFFKYPEGLVIKNNVCIGHEGSGIDIRAEGGMVIAPPSKTSYGEYSWSVSPFDIEFADLPPKLLELLITQPGILPTNKKALSDLIGLKAGEGRNNAMASLLGTMFHNTSPDKWGSEVLPKAILLNNSNIPPMDPVEFEKVYESIKKIELVRRAKLIPSIEEEALFIPAMSHKELLTYEFPESRFTLEPFFEQGTMNMVSVPPNTWKSWLLFSCAGHISKGTSVCDKFATEKSNVMIVNEEDSARSIQERLRALNIIDNDLPIYYRIAQGAKLSKDFIEKIIKEAKEKNIGVIMFDSLRAIHEADENNSTEMQKVLDLLKTIARENITVIFTHHHRKKQGFGKSSRNDEPADATRGSSAINAAISGHISLEEIERDGEKILIVRHLKSKVGEKLKPFELGIERGPTIISFRYLGEHKAREQALSNTKAKILSELEDRKELMGRKDFHEMKLGGLSTVKEATVDLVKAGHIKIISRAEASARSMKIYNQAGKQNENLYYVEEADNFEDLFAED